MSSSCLHGASLVIACLLGASCAPERPAPRKPAVPERVFLPAGEPNKLYEVSYNGPTRRMTELPSLAHAGANSLVVVDFPDDEESPDQFYLVERGADVHAAHTARLVTNSELVALASAIWRAEANASQLNTASLELVVATIKETRRVEAQPKPARPAQPDPPPGLVVEGATPDANPNKLPQLPLLPRAAQDVPSHLVETMRTTTRYKIPPSATSDGQGK
jgi:hypothetical protein